MFLNTDPLSFDRCAVISKPAPGSTNTYNCKGMEGRYVNIVIPSQTQMLTLCEVKVTGQCSEKPAPNGDLNKNTFLVKKKKKKNALKQTQKC